MSLAGVCIGGPLGGKRLEHHDQVYHVMTRPVALLTPQSHGRQSSPDRHYYTYAQIEGFGVWLFNHDTPKNAVARLLAIYMAATSGDKEDD